MSVFLAPGILALALLLWLSVRWEASLHTRISALGRRLGPYAVRFGIPFVLFLVLGAWYVSRHHLTGDEPEYHLMAESLWQDGDLLIRQPGWTRERRTAHEPGAALVAAPAQAAFGRLGIVLVMSAAAAITAAEAWRLAMLASGSNPAASALAWLVALGPPLLFHSYLFYSEALSAAFLALGLRAVLDQATRGAPLVAGMAVGVLPWLHVKMIPGAALLAVLFLVRRPWRQSARCLAVVAVSGGAYLVLRAPARSALRFLDKPPPALREPSPSLALAGQWLDAAHGLLPFAPVFLLALAALTVPRSPSRQRGVLVLAALSVIGPLLFFQKWWGGECAPARYFVPATAVLAALVAVRTAHSSRGLARLAPGLAVFGLVLGVTMTLQREQNWVALGRDEPAPIWHALSGPVASRIDRYLPLLTLRTEPAPVPFRPPVAEQRVAISLGAAVLLLLTGDRLALALERVDRGFRWLLLPMVLLCAHVLLVDFWARSVGP